jgi:hypothetical protein
MVMAPLFAHVQMRVSQNANQRQFARVPHVLPRRPSFEVPRRIHTV